MDRVEDLRKEVAPHLRFLKKQVEKVEKSFALKEELKQDYLEYLKTEEVFLEQERRDILDKRKPLLERKEETEKEISRIKSILSESKENQETSSEIIALDEALRKVRHEKDEFMRDIGRLEGEIAAEERIIQSARKNCTLQMQVREFHLQKS
jgi:chromosome segregation ATPase